MSERSLRKTQRVRDNGTGSSFMSTDLTLEQQEAIQHAIQSGVIESIDDFITLAIDALSDRRRGLDKSKARLAGDRIRELRKGVKLDLGGMSIRELARIGHRY